MHASQTNNKRARKGPMKLLSPISIGSMRLKNRIVMSPMTTNYANDDQTPSKRLQDYLVERARGGVGLITVEVCSVDTRQKYQPYSMNLGDDCFIEGHRRLTDALHEHGAKAQPQITHPGPESLIPLYHGEMAVGPSYSTGACHGMPVRELAVVELDSIVESYAQAARRAREAGYDGIELHAAHGYMLLGSFLSPLKNKRTDEYGCDTPENRTRLLVRVLKRIGEVAGEDFPITLRISGFERTPGGRDACDTAAIAPLLVAAGVDAFHISGGVSDPMVAQMICGMEYRDGYNVPAAEAVKRVVDVPVMVVGRFLDPELGEQVLQEERADMIVMARAMLADPQLPNKLANGQLAQLRRCISCQNCIDSMFLWPMEQRMACAVNAASGREGELSYTPATHRKHIVVVGAGPAGLEAARVAAERGHRVTLLEKRRRLGGLLVLASAVHKDNGRLLKFLTSEVKRLPVTIRLGQAADLALVQSLNPDDVVIATGSQLQYPDLPGLDGSNAITAGMLRELVNGEPELSGAGFRPWLKQLVQWTGPAIDRHLTPERLRRAADMWLPVGKTVVVLGADLAAIEVAEFLARRGRHVVILEAGAMIAPDIGPKRRLEHEKRLEEHGVSINTGVTVEGINLHGVQIAIANGVSRQVNADTVIVAGKPVADTSLAEQLQAAGISSHCVGDATGWGLIVKAIYDGNRVAQAL